MQPVLCHWATTTGQPPALYTYCIGGTSHTPGSHSEMRISFIKKRISSRLLLHTSTQISETTVLIMLGVYFCSLFSGRQWMLLNSPLELYCIMLLSCPPRSPFFLPYSFSSSLGCTANLCMPKTSSFRTGDWSSTIHLCRYPSASIGLLSTVHQCNTIYRGFALLLTLSFEFGFQNLSVG